LALGISHYCAQDNLEHFAVADSRALTQDLQYSQYALVGFDRTLFRVGMFVILPVPLSVPNTFATKWS